MTKSSKIDILHLINNQIEIFEKLLDSIFRHNLFKHHDLVADALSHNPGVRVPGDIYALCSERSVDYK